MVSPSMTLTRVAGVAPGGGAPWEGAAKAGRASASRSASERIGTRRERFKIRLRCRTGWHGWSVMDALGRIIALHTLHDAT